MPDLVLKVITIKPLMVCLSRVFLPFFSDGRDSCSLSGEMKIDTYSINTALQPNRIIQTDSSALTAWYPSPITSVLKLLLCLED